MKEVHHDQVRINRIRDELDRRDLLEMVESVCKERRLFVDDVLGRRRFSELAAARHECWRRMYEDSDRCYSLPTIGRVWERNHVTVLLGIRQARLRVAETHGHALAYTDPLSVAKMA